MQAPMKPVITINGGSSGIKCSCHETLGGLSLFCSGAIKNKGGQDPVFEVQYAGEDKKPMPVAGKGNHEVQVLAGWLRTNMPSPLAVAHRVVYGSDFASPCPIDAALLQQLEDLVDRDPQHLPAELSMIKLFMSVFPTATHLACFDTAFHRHMPGLATLVPLPRLYRDKGIRRYGFHGLSYTYLLQELERRNGKGTADGKLVLAHLGSGASLAAVNHGRCQDTSMGFTPAAGLPMRTRTGDLDPGIAEFLIRTENMDAAKFRKLTNEESGLLGISGTTGDMQQLLERGATDPAARLAVDYFCYQVKKWIGAYAAALEGLETLVFSGGIGQIFVPNFDYLYCLLTQHAPQGNHQL